jgi:hypothetical protein
MKWLLRSKAAKIWLLAGYLFALLTSCLVHNHPENFHSFTLSVDWGAATGNLRLDSLARGCSCRLGPVCTFPGQGSWLVPQRADFQLGDGVRSDTTFQSSYCPSCDFLGLKVIVTVLGSEVIPGRTGWHERCREYLNPFCPLLGPYRVRSPPLAKLL